MNHIFKFIICYIGFLGLTYAHYNLLPPSVDGYFCKVAYCSTAAILAIFYVLMLDILSIGKNKNKEQVMAAKIRDLFGGSEMSLTHAKIALIQGEKVAHSTFVEGEYIHMDHGKLCDEEMNRLNPSEFWSIRNTKVWMTGWYILMD